MRTRFAPSPNGYLHAGHAFSALTVWNAAAKAGGEALLRLDDIDQSRARTDFEAAIYDDLAWLGLTWPHPVRRQSDHMDAYDGALTALSEMGVTYPCFCTRKTLRLNKNGHYSGTCRSLSEAEKDKRRARGETPSIRLHASRALSLLEHPPRYEDTSAAVSCAQAPLEDAILARRDIGSSYLLSCVVDDAAQDITHVIRGRDIQPLTSLQVLLQALLGLPTPVYHHHTLITDDAQQKLSKSKGSQSIQELRAGGVSAEQLKALLAFG
ncbi:MAG: tRNA glutamyl-Q(34) synthetase GluQRS [Pseudomonadota bacterium]